MLRINVPAFRQPENKLWCGPACAQMISAYYGIDMSQRQIAKKLPMVEGGVDIGGLGAFFISQGFRVRIKFWLRGMKPRWFGCEDPKKLERILEVELSETKCRCWNWYCPRLLKYLKAGGQLIFQPVWAGEITEELRANRPMIIGLNSSLMLSRNHADRGHYVVPVGINKLSDWREDKGNVITFIDPIDGYSYGYILEKFMFLCHMWNGGGLFLEPPAKIARLKKNPMGSF